MIPATFGGPGWKPRPASFLEELPRLWTPVGTNSEYATLLHVFLIEPPLSLAQVTDPDANLMLSTIDFSRIKEEYEGLVAAYENAGVRVLRYRPPPDAPPNLIFARDLCWAGPEGMVIGRMASEVRAGEEKYASMALASAGIPLRATIGGRGCMEGADLLWLRPDTVMFGVGRSNGEALSQLRALFPEIRWIPVPVPMGVQHLLGAINFFGEGEAMLHPGAGPELRKVLFEGGVQCWEVEDQEELIRYRALNFVTLAPKKVLLPDHCPQTRRQLEARGVEVTEVEVEEYRKAAGGPGCLTGILLRQSVQPG